MEINENYFGFNLKSKRVIYEVSGTLNIFEHEKSGARLCYLEREDENKTFAIAFKTPPRDSTGVFHIIEHSVLSGSRKFPVKEPFVELLKGSLNTFLNALTYEDKTVYPVASRNEKDFFNLTEVYLDAVFHPLMLEDKAIFYNEGWRYEYGECGELTYNGVVYNEMKGAYSSPDELAVSSLNKALFSGSIYEYDSGGDPEEITRLSYEDFVNAHKRYYHPSNSYIFLDGSLDIEKALKLIDSYLSEYERREQDIIDRPAAPRDAGVIKIPFEPTGEGKEARVISASVFADCNKPEMLIATSVLLNSIAGSNDSPLKKAMIDEGLCEDVSVFTNTALMQTVMLEYHGVEPENADKILKRQNEILTSLANGALDEETIRANLDRLKFRYREKDYGALPKGVAFALSVYGVWLYGIDPAVALSYEDTLNHLYSRLGTDFYFDTLRDMLIDSPNKAAAILTPDKACRQRKDEALKSKLAIIKQEMTPEEREEIKNTERLVKKRNESQDSEEALATLPTLKLSDIKLSEKKNFTREFSSGGSKILCHDLETDGIMYTELYFSVHDLSEEELSLLSVLSSVLTNSDTEHYAESELKNKIRSALGSFSIIASSIDDATDTSLATPYVTIHTSALVENREELVHLIGEVLTKTKFSDTKNIQKILLQIRSVTEESILLGGDGVAMERVDSALCSYGATQERISGLMAYEKIKEYIRDFDTLSEAFAKRLGALAKRIFIKERLTVGCTGCDGQVAEDIVKLFPSGKIGERIKFEPSGIRAEGILLPLEISHAALGIFSEKIPSLMGAFKVARNILSYEYLWSEIRVKGGAYGAGFTARRHGTAIFYSYRDPSPESSVRCFERAADFLSDFAKEEPDLTKYIIGAIGEYDIIQTPRSKATTATVNYLANRKPEQDKKIREDILSTSSSSLIQVAEIIKEALPRSAITVTANGNLLSSVSEINGNIITP